MGSKGRRGNPIDEFVEEDKLQGENDKRKAVMKQTEGDGLRVSRRLP